jgi:transposase
MVLPPKKCKPLAEPKKKPLAVACEAALDEWQAQTQIERLNGDAAGIDIGATSHFVAVPADRDEQPVREFPAFTADLERLADWLKQCGIRTVAMESTGVYWIPLFELLESRGFEVLLVNAHHVKNVPGRKTDVLDCQWLQQLHSFGLLRGAFRPEESMCVLRAYLRQRANLVRYAGMHVQHMQKALNQMNLHLHHVVSDITGVTGMKIIRAILDGESTTDAQAPPPLRKHKVDRNTPAIDDLHEQLFRLVGVDLTRIDGLNAHSVLKILAEIGTDMSRWPSVKQFCSWLGLSPGNKISGGKRIGKSKTTPSANRAAAALRIAAQGLSNSHSALGGYLRRQKARLGAPKAITATAHKLATILYSMIANQTEYAPPDANDYEVQYRKRVLSNLRRRADQLGFDLIERPA